MTLQKVSGFFDLSTDLQLISLEAILYRISVRSCSLVLMMLVWSQVQGIEVVVTKLREKQVDEFGYEEFYLGAKLTYGKSTSTFEQKTDRLEFSKFLCLENGESIELRTQVPMPAAFELKVLTTTDSGSYQKEKKEKNKEYEYKFSPKDPDASRACFIYGYYMPQEKTKDLTLYLNFLTKENLIDQRDLLMMTISIEDKQVTFTLSKNIASKVSPGDKSKPVYEYKLGRMQTCAYSKPPKEIKFDLGGQTYALNDISRFQIAFVDQNYKPSIAEDAKAQNGNENAGATVPFPTMIINNDNWKNKLDFPKRLNLAIQARRLDQDRLAILLIVLSVFSFSFSLKKYQFLKL